MSTLDPTEAAIQQHPLPRSWVRAPKLVAAWINAVVPCLKGDLRQSTKVWSQVSGHLARAGVSPTDTTEAVRLSGEKFDFGLVPNLMINLKPPTINSGPSMSEAPPMGSLVEQARLINSHFLAAQSSGNAHDMEALAKMLIDILRLVGDWKAKRDGADKKTRDIQAEILRNSRAVGAVIRLRGPKDAPPPGPDGRRVRQIGPNAYEFVIDEDALREAATEGEADDAEPAAD
jgi:hypothetical protein